MKRALALLLAALLLLPLAACAGRGEAEIVEPTAPVPAETAVQPAPTEEPEPPADDRPEPLPAPTQPVGTADEPEDAELVCVSDFIPDLFIELRYGTPDNFTGRTIYDFTDAWLRYGTVRKLSKAQRLLRELGYTLKLWDAYRPTAAQFSLWAAKPDSAFVADPHRGRSYHANGGTVDITLVALDGSLIEMPTDFDEFSARADRDYSDVSAEAREHAELLEEVMTAVGFAVYEGEWWHFSDCESYPYEDLERLPYSLNRQTAYEPVCEETISLRARPDASAEVLAQIPRGAVFGVIGWTEGFARIKYDRRQGYVSCDYIRPAGG